MSVLNNLTAEDNIDRAIRFVALDCGRANDDKDLPPAIRRHVVSPDVRKTRATNVYDIDRFYRIIPLRLENRSSYFSVSRGQIRRP
jgi:hypothetical protein